MLLLILWIGPLVEFLPMVGVLQSIDLITQLKTLVCLGFDYYSCIKTYVYANNIRPNLLEAIQI